VRLEAVPGDITRQDVDAIVNAANSTLLGGGGVDHAIHEAAGPGLLAACTDLRRTTHPAGLPAGDAATTPGFDLPAVWVVHTVGPQHWEHPDGGVALLASGHTRSRAACDAVGATTVAFPAIPCGAYGWSPREAAPIAVAAVRDYAAAHPDSGVTLVRFVLFNDDALEAFADAISAVE